MGDVTELPRRALFYPEDGVAVHTTEGDAHHLHLTRRRAATGLLMTGPHCNRIAGIRLPLHTSSALVVALWDAFLL